MAVTRIKNNQITDSTITYTKIAAGTLVGSNFNQNLTLNSNISIVGNLTVSGVSSSISSTNTYVNDPIVVFNNGYAGSLAGYDIGMLVNRNLASLAGYGSVNTAWVWVEADNAFEAITTTDTGTGITTINNSGFANVIVGNLTAASGTFSGTIAAAILSGSHTGTAAFSTAVATNFSTGNAQITGGNVQGLAYLNTSSFSTGNAVITGGSLNSIIIGGTTPAAGFFTSLTGASSVITGDGSVGGNLSVAGDINLMSGNITTANSAFFVGNTVTGFGAIYAGIPSGYSVLPQVVAQFSENYNGYSQINSQNINAGGDATTDYVATANNGSDTTFYIDLGIAGSGYDPLSPNNSLGTSLYANDAYLYTQGNSATPGIGGNLVLGTATANTSIKFLVGGVNSSNIAIQVNNPGTLPTSTSTGTFVVNGGVGISGNINVGQYNASYHQIMGNIVFGQGTPTSAAGQSTVVINQNSTTPQNTTSALHVSTLDGKSGKITIDSFGTNQSSIFVARTARGTSAIPTASQTNDLLGAVVGRGYGATGFNINSPATSNGIAVYAAQPFTDSAQGAYLALQVTPLNSTVATQALKVDSTGNVVITSTTASSTTTTGALVVAGGIGVAGTVTATTFSGNGNFPYAVATNFSSGNVQITGGSLTGITAAATTLVATNFSTANAQITGGSITNFDGQSNTFTATNFSTGNARIDGGFLQGINTLQATNFSSGNILITGGSLTGVNGQFNTLAVTNFSSGNIAGVLTGTASTSNVAVYQTVNNSVVNTDFYPEFTDRFTTGNSASYVSAAFKMNPFTGIFSASGVNVTAVTPASSSLTGALIVTGGTGIGGNLYVGSDATIVGNLTVQGTMTAIQSQTLDVTDLNITVAKGAANPTAANGAGITVDAAGATLVYAATTDSWNFNKQVIGQFTTSNLQATGGSVTGITGSANTFTATNFSSGNVQISGGNAQGLGFVQTTNLSTSNAAITGGSVTGITGSATTFHADNFSSGNIIGVLTGTASTSNVSLYSDVTATTNTANFYPMFTDRSTTGNSSAFITPGIIMNPGTNSIQATAFVGTFNGTASITSGSLTNVTGSANYWRAANFSSGNVLITSGNVNLNTLDAIEFGATNLFTANAKIIGGNITGIRGNAITFSVGTFAANSANIIGGNITNISNFTTSNFFTSNALITGGAITGVMVDADLLSVTNFSTGNAVLSGGSIDSIAIGQTSPSQATFTNLTVNGVTTQVGNLVIASSQDMINPTSAALVIPNGGASVAQSMFIGETLYVGANSLTIPLVNSSISAVNSGTDFVQIGLTNTVNTASADFAGYASNGDNNGGWVDMGFTGPAFNDPAYTLTRPNDGYLIARPQLGFGGNLVLATSEAGTFNDVVIGVGSFDLSSEVARFHGNASTGGYLQLTQGTLATSSTTGALRVTGGVGVSGNVYTGTNLVVGGTGFVTGNVSLNNAVTINSSQTAGMDFKVAGVNSSNLIWARPNGTYDQVLIGNTATVGTLVQGAKLYINSTDSMMLPAGTSGQRPGNSGGSDVPGMFRYNTTLNAIEYFGGSEGTWSTVSTQFTLISDQQFSGTGSQVNFTLSSNQTTNNCIVSINGAIQLPILAYSITANVLTFTSAPANGAVIDVRKLTTTNQITELASQNDHVIVALDNTAGIQLYSGASGRTLQRTMDLSGAWVGQATPTTVSGINAVTSVDAFALATYRSAKYLIQATVTGKHQVMEALVIHDGTTATITTYGIVQTNGNVGVLSATVSGGNVNVNFIAANANTDVRVSKEYVLI